MKKLKNIKSKKYYFSDRHEILKSINIKNKKLFSDLRLNIIQEKSKLISKKIEDSIKYQLTLKN